VRPVPRQRCFGSTPESRYQIHSLSTACQKATVHPPHGVAVERTHSPDAAVSCYHRLGYPPRTSVCRPWVISVSMSSGTDTSQRSSRRSTEQPIDRRYRSVNCSTTDCVTEIEASVIALTKIKPFEYAAVELLKFAGEFALFLEVNCHRIEVVLQIDFGISGHQPFEDPSSKLVPDSSKRLRSSLVLRRSAGRDRSCGTTVPVRTPRPYLSTPY